MDWKTLVGATLLFHLIVYAVRREWVLRVDTRKLNHSLNSIGSHPIRKYFKAWFRVGTYATLFVGFPFTAFLFLRTLFYAVFPSILSVAVAVTTPATTLLYGGETEASSSEPPLELHHPEQSPYPDANLGVSVDEDDNNSSYLAIQPILPGWNLPLSHLPYYLLAILVSVVVHELGHAVASAAHKIPIQSVGVTVFGPLIPAAHVELNSGQLREAPVRKQLDILTAGVWMNLYLALFTYFLIPPVLPAILWPTHSMGTGLAVTAVYQNSGIGGPGGLHVGDIITGIEKCPVQDLDSWYTCLEKIWETPPLGYCVSDEVLMKYANDSEGCCSSGDNSQTHLCFLHVGEKNETADNKHRNSTSNPSHCLPAQPVMAEVEARCFAPSYSCHPSPGDEEDHNQTCLLPRLVREVKSFRIVEIERRQGEPKGDVLFVGNVMDLSEGMRTSQYVPRSSFLTSFLGFEGLAKFPEKLETLLLLTAGLSAGLAVVNMLPIYGLDGYHMVEAVARAYFGPKRWESGHMSRVVSWISRIALIVALLTVFTSLLRSFHIAT